MEQLGSEDALGELFELRADSNAGRRLVAFLGEAYGVDTVQGSEIVEETLGGL